MAGQLWWNSATSTLTADVVEVEAATIDFVAALMLDIVTMAAELVLAWVAADEYG